MYVLYNFIYIFNDFEKNVKYMSRYIKILHNVCMRMHALEFFTNYATLSYVTIISSCLFVLMHTENANFYHGAI